MKTNKSPIRDCIVFPHEEPAGGPVGGYRIFSKVEKLAEENIKTSVKVVTRHFVTAAGQ